MTKKTDEDKIIYGTVRGEVLRGGSGNDRIYALGGNDHIFAGAGNDTAEGGAGNDKIHGDDGNDVLLGGAGNDCLDGDDGDDWLDGGAGSDEVDGGKGSDTLVYRLADHDGEATGARAPFTEADGGSGADTLQLVLTRAEWLRTDVQADVARALTFIADNTSRDGEAGGREFKFSAFNLEFERIEKLAVVVDGLAIDPRDAAVTACADTLTATEDAPSLAVNLLANDAVPDLVRSVSVGAPTRGSVTLTQDYSSPAAPMARAVYTPNSSAFQYLAAGETATDSFSYTVTDADGDVATATVTVTIQGANDGPAILGGSFAGAVSEDAGPRLTAGGTITFDDADLTDTHGVTVGAARTSVTGTAPAGLPASGYGQLTARVVETTTDQNPQGSIVWDFVADDAAVQGLAEGQTATQVYTLTLTDRAGTSVTRDVTVTLTGRNDAPQVVANVPSSLTAAAGNLNTDAAFSFDLKTLFKDADGDAPTITVDELPDGFILSNGELTQTRASDPVSAGDYTLSVKADDGKGGITTKTVTLAVALENDYGDFVPPGGVDGSKIVTGSNGDDTITFGIYAAFQSGTVTVNTGKGSDKIVFGDKAGAEQGIFVAGPLSIDVGANDHASDTVTFLGSAKATISSFESGFDKLDLNVNTATLAATQIGNDVRIASTAATGTTIDITLKGFGPLTSLADFIV